MKRILILSTVMAAGFLGYMHISHVREARAAAGAAVTSVTPANVQAPPAPITLPQGAILHVRLNESVSTRRNRPGDHFSAVLMAPVMVNGEAIAPAGTMLRGTVREAERSGRLKGRAVLVVALDTIHLNNRDYEIDTTSQGRRSSGHKRRNFAWIGGGSGAGALIGAVATGGVGAAIGAGAGAAAGVTGAAITGRKDVSIPAETPMTFRLARPVTVS
jgi:hypothetical protein